MDTSSVFRAKPRSVWPSGIIHACYGCTLSAKTNTIIQSDIKGNGCINNTLFKSVLNKKIVQSDSGVIERKTHEQEEFLFCSLKHDLTK